MAFCGKCGTKNKEGARFCSECGSHMGDINEQKTENKTPLKKELSKEEDFTVDDFADAIKDVGRIVNKEIEITAGSENKNVFKLKPIRIVLSIIGLILFVNIFGYMEKKEKEKEAIHVVYNTTPKAYNKVSFGNAFDAFMDNTQWSAHKQGKEHIVEVTGYAHEFGNTTKLEAKILVNDDEVKVISISNGTMTYDEGDSDLGYLMSYIMESAYEHYNIP